MTEINRLTDSSEGFKVDFVEREATPQPLKKLGIRLHLTEPSLLYIVSEYEIFGVKRSRKAAHDWVQKADFQPASDSVPNQIALDETVIRVDDEPF